MLTRASMRDERITTPGVSNENQRPSLDSVDSDPMETNIGVKTAEQTRQHAVQ